MNRVNEVNEIISLPVSNDDKRKKLQDFLLDCFNEMEAQDQNMHPEIKHNLAQAYQLAKDYLRDLQKD